MGMGKSGSWLGARTVNVSGGNWKRAKTSENASRAGPLTSNCSETYSTFRSGSTGPDFTLEAPFVSCNIYFSLNPGRTSQKKCINERELVAVLSSVSPFHVGVDFWTWTA